MISDRWFSVNERFWAVSIASFSNYVGWAFGAIFPPAYCDSDPTNFVRNSLKCHLINLKNKLTDVVLIQAIIASVPLVFGVLVIREKPKLPPNYSAVSSSI